MLSQILTFVIPAFNEENTIGKILLQVCEVKLPDNFRKKIIVVDDGSHDRTLQLVQQLALQYKFIRLLKNNKNLGKSQTVKRGILESQGDYLVIQDADLEYNPEDIGKMLKFMIEHKYDVVYGNRFAKKNKVIYWRYYLGNRCLSFFSNFFTYFRIRKFIPDIEVCYKLFKGEIIREIGKTISAKSSFGFEPEVTAKMSKFIKAGKHLNVGIFPIDYYPRSLAEGKKLKIFRDGIKALAEIIRFNF